MTISSSDDEEAGRYRTDSQIQAAALLGQWDDEDQDDDDGDER